MNEKINLPELTALLAEKADITKKEAETFLREFFGLITESLVDSNQVKIKDLGTFKLTKVEDRESVNVRTGERVLIPAHQKISFSVSGQLSETINEPFALFEPVELEAIDPTKEHVSITNKMDEDTDEIDVEEEENTIDPIKNESSEEILKDRLTIENTEEQLPPMTLATPVSTSIEEVINNEPEQEPVFTKEVEITERESGNEVIENKNPEKKKKKCRVWITILFLFILLILLAGGACIYLWYTNPQFKTTADSLIKTTVASFDKDKNPEKEIVMPQSEVKPVEKANEVPVQEAADSTTMDTVATEPIVSPEKQQPDKKVQEKPKETKKQLSSEDKTYTLQDGQRLTLIALREYGNKIFWVYIYEENKASLESPHVIPIGTKLKIPSAQKYGIDKNSSESINKARALAKKYE